MRGNLLAGAACALISLSSARGQAAPVPDDPRLLVPARVFDATTTEMHEGWVVLVRRGRIDAVGPATRVTAPSGTQTIRLDGMTLLPGLIEAHSHLLLHPYNEATWDNQVLREPEALRV